MTSNWDGKQYLLLACKSVTDPSFACLSATQMDTECQPEQGGTWTFCLIKKIRSIWNKTCLILLIEIYFAFFPVLFKFTLQFIYYLIG